MDRKALSDQALFKILWILVIAMGVYLAIKIIQGLV